mgnify:CR=1 FL=1
MCLLLLPLCEALAVAGVVGVFAMMAAIIAGAGDIVERDLSDKLESLGGSASADAAASSGPQPAPEGQRVGGPRDGQVPL